MSADRRSGARPRRSARGAGRRVGGETPRWRQPTTGLTTISLSPVSSSNPGNSPGCNRSRSSRRHDRHAAFSQVAEVSLIEIPADGLRSRSAAGSPLFHRRGGREKSLCRGGVIPRSSESRPRRTMPVQRRADSTESPLSANRDRRAADRRDASSMTYPWRSSMVKNAQRFVQLPWLARSGRGGPTTLQARRGRV